jgi:hypothetical protein
LDAQDINPGDLADAIVEFIEEYEGLTVGDAVTALACATAMVIAQQIDQAPRRKDAAKFVTQFLNKKNLDTLHQMHQMGEPQGTA